MLATPVATKRTFLHWGQLAVAGAGAQLVTIVGSCVAVCLWDPGRRLGGMNHYLLPEAPRVPQPVAKPWSYGELALPELLAQLVAAGASPLAVTAKVFGGAAISRGEDQGGPGPRNAAFARRWLGERRIPIVAHDLGGRRGRKLVFDVGSGDTTVGVL
jgi:chemotaxis protein CheD